MNPKHSFLCLLGILLAVKDWLKEKLTYRAKEEAAYESWREDIARKLQVGPNSLSYSIMGVITEMAEQIAELKAQKP